MALYPSEKRGLVMLSDAKELTSPVAAIQRRPHNHWEAPWYLRQFLETEKRLASRAGDRVTAASAAKKLDALR